MSVTSAHMPLPRRQEPHLSKGYRSAGTAIFDVYGSGVPVDTIAEMLRELFVCGSSERVVGANNDTGNSSETIDKPKHNLH